MFLTQCNTTAAVLALAVLGSGIGQAQERQREGRTAPAFQGKITVLEEGKSLTLESGGRGEEPKKTTIILIGKTKVEFAGILKDLGLKLRVGDHAAVWLQEGSKETAAVIQGHRGPDHSARIKAVSADGKTLTLQAPGQGRGEEPTTIEIKITDQTKKEFGRGRGSDVPEEEKKLKPNDVAAVWLVVGSKDTAGAIQVSPPPPNAYGSITAISADAKEVTLETKGRGGDNGKFVFKVADTTKVGFINGEAKDRKFKVGQAVLVWLQEGSMETAAVVQVNLQRRSPDAAGTIAAISADGKMMTLEIRKRGEADSTRTEIKLTDKTELEFGGAEKAEEKKLTVGYSAAVWLQEGSKDTAAIVVAHKPGERRR